MRVKKNETFQGGKKEMKIMKKTIVIVLTACLLFALVSCKGKSDSRAAAAAPESKSSREQIAEIIEKSPLGLNGIQPNPLQDRAHINKALPVQKKDPHNVTIGYTAQSLGSVFFLTILETLQEECAKYGYNLIYQVADFNIELQAQQVDAFIAMGVDVIIVNGNTQSHTATFRRSADAGIPILATANQPAEWDSSVLTDFLTSSYQAGWLVGEYTGKHMYQPGKVYKMGFIFNAMGSADTESRANGFLTGFQYAMRELDGKPYESTWDAILDGYQMWRTFADRGRHTSPDGRVEFVGMGVGGQPTMEGGQRAANDLVAANRDMDVLFVETDNMWPGVEVVLRQNGLTAGKDLIVACAADATKFGMEAVMSGEILAVGNNSSAMNVYGMMDVIRGMYEFGENDKMNNLPANIFTPTVAITKENVHEFYDPDRNLAKGMPFDLLTIPEFNANVGSDGPPF